VNNDDSEISPASIVRSLKVRKSEIEKAISILDKTLKKAPEGRLRIDKNRSSRQYYHRNCSTDQRGKYIPTTNIALVKALAQKEYDRKLVATLRREHNAINLFIKNFHPEHVDENFRLLNEPRKLLVTPIRMIDEEYIEQWLSVEYEKKGFDTDAPELLTARNERVRSKSEIMIADALSRHGIPYRYEYPIYIEEIGVIHPDFLCLDPSTRKEILWEHFGMMTDPSYAENAVNRLEKYNNAGFYIGYNLIVTCETNNHPLNSRHIEQTIKRYLL
jgi:hypothetical protein